MIPGPCYLKEHSSSPFMTSMLLPFSIAYFLKAYASLVMAIKEIYANHAALRP
jgi:hypothetical protein